ncbi:MAG: ketopantoate reductase family protein, partial [Gaiellaceae bacterium]
MKVAVLGPGAVGGVLAVGLVRAGVSLVCVARPDTANVIASSGLTLRHGSQEAETVRPEATTELRECVDLLFVTVKATTLDDALGRIQAPPRTVIPLLNGIEHMQTTRSRLAQSDVVAGSVSLIEAYLEEPGTIVQTTPAVVLTLARDIGGEAAQLLRRAGAEVRIDGSELEVLWQKLARQAPVAAATSLAQRPIGELRNDPEWRRRLKAAVDE